MSEEDYKKLLEDHDWYYSYSDSPKVYDKGLENEKKLLAIAKTDKALQKLYNERSKKLF